MVNLAFIDGGGSVARPQGQPQSHTVAPNEKLSDIADRYGVQPQAIRDANPDIFGHPSARRLDNAEQTGEMIWSGDQLVIPAAPQSVTDDPLSSDFNPTYPSSNSEYSVNAQGEHTGGGITWNPGDGTVKTTVSQQGGVGYQHTQAPFGIPNSDLPGVSMEAKIRAETARTSGIVDKDGKTEVTVEAETNVVASVSAEATGKGVNQAELEASAGGGFRSRYKVTLPGVVSDREAAAKQAAAINPYDPTTIPKGATVTMDSQYYTQTGLAGSFRHIGFETNIKEAEGSSFSITRVDDNSVRVTMGPNEAVEAFNGIGVNSDIATAMVGRQDNLGDSTVRTAQFDLSNPDGQAAYAHFIATGQVADQTPGVSQVATIERTDYSSQTRVKIGIGPEELNLQADLAGAQNTGTWVKTTYPDGSYAMSMQLQYSGHVGLTVTERHDAQGNEILSERTYQFTVPVDGNNANMLNFANSAGVSTEGPFVPGKTATITMTEGQMRDFMAQTRTAADTFGPTSRPAILAYYGDGQPVTESLQFAVNLVRGQSGEPFRFAETLFSVSDAADGDIQGRDYQRIDMQVG